MEPRKDFRVTVKRLSLGDVEDPQLYVGLALHEWEKTEECKWLSEVSKEPLTWTTAVNHSTYGYDVRVTALLTEHDYTYYILKYQ